MRSSGAFQEISAELLSRGHRMRFCAEGKSMHPTIREGEAINIEPVAPAAVKRGDILLCRGPQGVMAHRVVAIKDVRGKGFPLLDPRSSFRSPRFSILDPHHSSLMTSFILCGDAAVTCESVESARVLGTVVSLKRHGRLARQS